MAGAMLLFQVVFMLLLVVGVAKAINKKFPPEI